jgi:glycosyltransferase involved in cell wall biosynthesis
MRFEALFAMRLALLGQFPFHAPPQGGVQSVLATLSQAFVARRDIELYVIQHRRGVPYGVFHHGEAGGQGYVVHNLPAPPRRLVPNMMRTGRLLTPLLWELAPDAISSHQPEYALAALASGLPLLHTIHGLPRQEFWARRGLRMRLATLLEVWLEGRMLGRLRHIVAISDRVIADYRRRTSAQFHRIDNPVAPLFFAPAPPPEPGRVLLVGNLTPRKGIDIALAAVARLVPHFANLHLEIIGAAVDPVYAARLRRQAEALDGAVSFGPPTTPAGIKEALDRAQVLLLTSRMEHVPVIVAEAMATGRPVVATAVAAVPDLVSPGETGLLAPPGDIEAIAERLAQVLAHPAQAAAMGAEAARRARQRFHPERVAAAYVRTLLTVTATW